MNYYKVFLAKPDYLIKFWRSLAMCLMIAAGQTLFSCMSGTAFVKIILFLLKNYWFITICTIYDFTDSGNTAAELYFIRKLKLLNSWKALIIPAIFSPFGTVWLTFVFQAIPDSTLDAARMDGVNQLQMIRYIIVPNSKPAVITLFILVFTESWNMVEQPILFSRKRNRLSPFCFFSHHSIKMLLEFNPSVVYYVYFQWHFSFYITIQNWRMD